MARQQENFLKDNKVINNLKLRLGWGATGNQNVQQWAYAAMLKNYTTSWGVGVMNANNANPELKWETTYSTNVGSTYLSLTAASTSCSTGTTRRPTTF